MSLLDMSVYIVIAVCYNLFIHQLVTILYKDMTYEEKYNNGITFIFISGILGLVISYVLDSKKKVVKNGLMLGGILLVITSMVANWDNMTDDVKLCLTGIIFSGIVWYFYNYYDKEEISE